MLQPKLSLKVSQRQILTPGLMQMVSVLALNNIELRDMIQNEMAENPMLEEMEESVPMLDHAASREADRELVAPSITEAEPAPERADPFEEIDFGSYFQEYLDPGFRSPQSMEFGEKPSIENYLSQGSTLIDHLLWQVSALSLDPALHAAVEYILGNLDDDGYCAASFQELLEGWRRIFLSLPTLDPADAEATLSRAMRLVRKLDPIGIGAYDLRECLLLQIAHGRRQLEDTKIQVSEANGRAKELFERLSVIELAERIVREHLALLSKRDTRELLRAARATPQQLAAAQAFLKTLDPLPGRRFTKSDTRLIEPDVTFVKRGDFFVAVMDDEQVPTLRLNGSYRRLLQTGEAEKDVKDYVKERYRSALQLMRNIEQRKNTILRTCESIVRRQGDFLEHGVEYMKPMMIKEVAEEIGVHPSTVSRAVANKYAHTPHGVFELRFFFSEAVNGPEGGATSLMLLKRRVKKLIEDEDPRKPLTDDVITGLLQKEGIDVTRRTVAKYREDMRIPSTHQRRVRG